MNVSAHRLIKPSKEQRVFFCGDVHGNYSQLQEQLREIGFMASEDILILTGDIIDRGIENTEMIEFATCTPGVYSVLGNHESMFLDGFNDELVRPIYTSANIGGSWIEKYSQPDLEDMATLIESCMPIAITVERDDFQIGVIHAASPLNWQDVIAPKPEDTEYHLWSREQFVEANNTVERDAVIGVDVVVHGHVCSDLTVSGNQIWIDTNWSTGKLSILESNQLLQLVRKKPSDGWAKK
jgi:serine/threonine protein phosphatase 1